MLWQYSSFSRVVGRYTGSRVGQHTNWGESSSCHPSLYTTIAAIPWKSFFATHVYSARNNPERPAFIDDSSCFTRSSLDSAVVSSRSEHVMATVLMYWKLRGPPSTNITIAAVLMSTKGKHMCTHSLWHLASCSRSRSASSRTAPSLEVWRSIVSFSMKRDYTHTHTHTHTHVICTYIIYTHIIYIHTHTHTHSHIHTHTHTYIHIHTHITHTSYITIYTYTYIYIHIHIHTYTHGTNKRVSKWGSHSWATINNL